MKKLVLALIALAACRNAPVEPVRIGAGPALPAGVDKFPLLSDAGTWVGNKALDLAGPGVTGVLPAGNQAAQAVSGTGNGLTLGGNTGAVILSGTTSISGGGTGQVTAQTAFDALSPLTTGGDLLYYNGTHNARVAAGTSGLFLQTQGVGGGAPIWAAAGGTPKSYVTAQSGDVGYTSTTQTITVTVPSLAGRNALYMGFTISGGMSANGTIRARVKLDGTYKTGFASTFNVNTAGSSACGTVISASAGGHTVTADIDTDGVNTFYVYTSGATVPVVGIASPAYPMQAVLTVTEGAL